MLNRIVDEQMLEANGVIGFYPAQSIGEDVEIYEDESKSKVLATFRFLRNQQQKSDNLPNLSLADFIAPKDSGISDYLGFFAVTAGVGIKNGRKNSRKTMMIITVS